MSEKLVAFIFLFFTYGNFAEASAGGVNKGKAYWWTYPLAMGYVIFFRFKEKRKDRKVKAALIEMEKLEPEWSEASLLNMIQETFFKVQSAWGAKKLEDLKKLLHPTLYDVWSREIISMQRRNEKENWKDARIISMKIVDVRNHADGETDEFTVCIDASVRCVKYRNSQIVQDGRPSRRREYWTYEKISSIWVVREISQQSAQKRFVSSAVASYSKSV
ncbi:MAG: TIM44-like domain-containing protein [Bdellovibrionota bacterium]